MRIVPGLTIALIAMALSGGAGAAEIKVLTAGAFKQVLLALVPAFEKQTGHKVTVENDTVGALTKRIEGGEAFDVAVLTPAAVNDLTGKGKFVEGTRCQLGTGRRRGHGQGGRAGSPTSARSRRSSVRCWPPSRSPISIRRAAARAASMSRACSTSSASPIRSSRRPS